LVPDPERYTRPVTEHLLAVAEQAVVPVVISTPGKVVGVVGSRWRGITHLVSVVSSSRAVIAALPGQTIKIISSTVPVPPDGRRGARVGIAVYSVGSQHEPVLFQLAAPVPEPTWWWRLTHR
jgi:hypothetical protein